MANRCVHKLACLLSYPLTPIFPRSFREIPQSCLPLTSSRTMALTSVGTSRSLHPRKLPMTGSYVTAVSQNARPRMEQPGPLSSEPARSRLRALLLLAEVEARQGRWLHGASEINSSTADDLLIGPLSKSWNLKAKVVWSLVSFVCSLNDQQLSNCEEIVSSSDANYIRLELLNPSRVMVDLFDPLFHLGIAQPQKLLANCPALLLSSAIPSRSPVNQWKRPILDRKTTLLLEALDELGSCVDRGDLIMLLNRFPEVLLRPRQELAEIYSYLTENMNLQSTELARATQMRAHRHTLRKGTGLRLATCPAWRLPLNKVRARHLLALFAGCWPPSQSSVDGMTGNLRLAKLLTAPVNQVPHWLGAFTPKDTPVDGRISSSPSEIPVSLTSNDVRTFESLVSRLCLGEADTATEKGAFRSVYISLLESDVNADDSTEEFDEEHVEKPDHV